MRGCSIDAATRILRNVLSQKNIGSRFTNTAEFGMAYAQTQDLADVANVSVTSWCQDTHLTKPTGEGAGIFGKQSSQLHF